MHRTWSDADIARLRELYPVLPTAEVGHLMPGYTRAQIKCAASRHKITKLGRLISWRHADELRLIELYPNISNAELAVLFGKTEAAIIGAGFKLQLRKTEQFLRERSAKGFFKPGQAPVNKGRRMAEWMTPEGVERSSKTRFKGGQLPKNTVPVGTVVIDPDGYYREKIGEPNKWAFCHRLIYVQHFGPIPAGQIVVFRDGDRSNLDPVNLELITRKEHAMRNQNRDKAAQSMRKAYQEGRVNNPFVRMHDKAIAAWLFPRNTNMQAEILRHPEIIELKRNQIKTKRYINDAGNAKEAAGNAQ